MGNHTYYTLLDDLKNMGFRRDETVLVHSSMKSIGDVEGRADTVLDALMYHFKYGLLVFPTLSWSLVNDKQPVFDVRETPSVVGILPELFRKRPEVIRSLHPTHSLAAYGGEAETFTEGHERFDTPAAIGSPWRRLIGFKAKILFIGASIAHNTFLHGVEEWGHGANILTDTHQNLKVIDYKGREISVPSRRHLGGHSTFYGCLEEQFKRIGALKYGRFGDAKCTILDAAKIANLVIQILKAYPAAFNEDWNEQNPDFFLRTVPDYVSTLERLGFV